MTRQEEIRREVDKISRCGSCDDHNEPCWDCIDKNKKLTSYVLSKCREAAEGVKDSVVSYGFEHDEAIKGMLCYSHAVEAADAAVKSWDERPSKGE